MTTKQRFLSWQPAGFQTIVFFVLILSVPLLPASAQVLNEFLAINHTFPDPTGQFADWLELYNPTYSAIPLGGLYLTDSLAWPTRWMIPDTVLSPGQFLLIWCDDDSGQGLHATFKLNGNGEQIGLFDRDGATPLDTLTYGPQQADTSFGRMPDGAITWMLLYPTPETSNQPLGITLTPAKAVPLTNFVLHPNYPNPFNASTTLNFYLPQASAVSLLFTNAAGQDIRADISPSLQGQRLAPGWHQVKVNGAGLASGSYIIRIKAGGWRSCQKLTLLK